jgi:hypothetical protein
MSRASTIVCKYSILIHRWMGVGFCVLFVVWFISGIVMMYWGYPGVETAERLSRSEPLDASLIQVSTEEAYTRLELGGEPDRVRINMLDGRPVYRFHYGAEQLIVYADTGEPVSVTTVSGTTVSGTAVFGIGEVAKNGKIGPEQALRIASAWTGQPADAGELQGALDEADQWTLSGFAALRPLFKFRWPDGEEVYVSSVTGEIVQHTTRGSRLGAYFGAIPHWLYFTPLRKNQALWHDVVVWSSGIGAVMTIFGIVVGVWLYSPSKRRFRFPGDKQRATRHGLWAAIVAPEGRSSIPYSGQKRWHTMLGLVFGLFACTWAFSGMLSMSPFDWQAERGTVDLGKALRGAEWRPEYFSAKHPRDALARVGPSLIVKEVELILLGGEPLYLAREAPQRSLLIPVQGAPREQLAQDDVLGLISQTVPGHQVSEVRVVREYESYYTDRTYALPLPALFIQLDDPQKSMYYVDMRTGHIVQSYGAGGRWNRWLYHGLHSFDLPWLYRHRPAWDVFVLLLMVGGTGLCITSVVIAWRRLRRKAAMRTAKSAYSAARGQTEFPSPSVGRR